MSDKYVFDTEAIIASLYNVPGHELVADLLKETVSTVEWRGSSPYTGSVKTVCRTAGGATRWRSENGEDVRFDRAFVAGRLSFSTFAEVRQPMYYQIS